MKITCLCGAVGDWPFDEDGQCPACSWGMADTLASEWEGE